MLCSTCRDLPYGQLDDNGGW
jgi:hypothetical protein